jgi:hypothetical protein
MADIEFRPYGGALYGDSVALGSAFVCSAAQMLITCAHCLRSNPKRLAWQPFDNGRQVKLRHWVIPVRDQDADVAVIINSVPLVSRSSVAELPRSPRARGLQVYFDGLGEFIEDGLAVARPDSGYGVLLGSGTPKAILRTKMESKNVTPGCSGSPVIHFSGIGDTVVGMVSGRYNSEDNWNRDTVWLVTAEAIRAAITAAQGALLAAQLSSYQKSDPLAVLDLEISPEQLIALLKASDRS